MGLRPPLFDAAGENPEVLWSGTFDRFFQLCRHPVGSLREDGAKLSFSECAAPESERVPDGRRQIG
jgi:hypothetical protein